ncbi:MAG: PqqD family peptide modification chaperone [Verrucomicrobia bacterium]|nr:PqqD family peptide modification chaperone [Verrucomicrobiota bacterium]
MGIPSDSDITMDSLVTRAPDQVSCNLGGESVMLNMKSGVYFGLNPIGARIWELLERPMKVSAIRDVLIREYQVEPERCVKELLSLLGDLHRARLIRKE